ncbi:Down syndrome cell adhesion molecule homolog isoform X2 [Sphaeramia orbicularis]|uniref:Down syndrome cell adhesion molecule homolog isoform X2 n=1 Tax=Sphaeramia orbicularis TaxID=375764 RepID=UPI00117D9785|nr:Down syndrome cell adhesion molecule homolog isoform X2 [Sphaeramia orbicularis]
MASCSRNLIFVWFLLAFPGCVSAESLEATVGADVTLTCKYDAQYYGVLSMCWGRGSIPNRGCAGEIIKTNGKSVTSSSSERYQLMGNLREGDVSLTIRQVEEGDSGTYGCRVDIPGWFNDHKHEITLTVVPGRPKPLKVETREVKERTITVRWARVFDGGRPITTYRVDLKNKQASWDTAVRTELYDPELTQVTLVDLRPAKTYNLRMFAINSVGMSESSNVLTVTTKEAAPDGPPIDMQLQALTSHSIKVTWKPPRADLRNGVLRSYSLSYREYDPAGRHFKKWQHQSITATREVETLTLTNLKPSTKYGVLIQAKTNAGIGPAATAPLCTTHDEEHQTSTAATAVTTSLPVTMWKTDSSITSVDTTSAAETVTGETTSASATVWEQEATTFTSGSPDPPVVELKEVKDFTISLLWTPGFEGGSPVTGYYLEYKAVNASWDYRKSVVDFSTNQTEATIIEMTPSTYNIRMFAKNSLGSSQASNVLTFTVKETGHQRDILPTTPSTDTKASSSFEEGRSGHLAAIVVPVVLAVLIVAIVTTWQLRRIKLKKGTLNMWLNNGAIRYRGAEAESL